MEVESSASIAELKIPRPARRTLDKIPQLRRHEQPLIPQMDDELHNTSVEKIQPLGGVIVQVPDRDHPTGSRGNKQFLDKDITADLATQFEYYSRTRDLEVDTPEKPSERVRILQKDVLDKMTEGTGLRTKVVIMNKGERPEASVYPDGTVFISQSLLNGLDSLDEVAATLAHELTHLINKTTLHTYRDVGVDRFGIGWIHEGACDANAPVLLEKAGFNSLAFSTAILKIQGMERGSIHQSGLTRASQSVGQHMAIDRTTSSTELTAIPTVLKKEVRKTNLEFIDELCYRETINLPEKSQEIKAALSLLHPNDLESVYGPSKNGGRIRWLPKEFEAECNNLISERLKEAGYTGQDFRLGRTISRNNWFSQYCF